MRTMSGEGPSRDPVLLTGGRPVRLLKEEDAEEVLALCLENPLYYRYYPPGPTRESVLRDMRALPPGKGYSDKYFLGYEDREGLMAVLDLILGYPDADTAFVGFFMTRKGDQGKGLGTDLVADLVRGLQEAGYPAVRLCWVKDNPQASSFWLKNGFIPLKEIRDDRGRVLVLAERA